MGLEVALQVVVCAINYPLLMLDVVDYSQPFYEGNPPKGTSMHNILSIEGQLNYICYNAFKMVTSKNEEIALYGERSFNYS